MGIVSTCPECRGEIPADASVCRHCTRRLSGRQCALCLEFSKPEARVCSCCRANLIRQKAVAEFEPVSIPASVIGSIFLRGRFIPQRIQLLPDKVVISTWGRFWLSRKDEQIPWEKVAGYELRAGLLWDKLEIETRGQSSNTITCLRKSQSRRIKAILDLMRN